MDVCIRPQLKAKWKGPRFYSIIRHVDANGWVNSVVLPHCPFRKATLSIECIVFVCLNGVRVMCGIKSHDELKSMMGEMENCKYQSNDKINFQATCSRANA